MSHTAVTLLVVAKAPVPGRAKTRIAAGLGDHAAAEIAASALLDTLDAAAATPVHARVVALTGDLEAACRAAELRTRLAGFTVIEQRGDGFAQRLAHAHADAATVAGGISEGVPPPKKMLARRRPGSCAASCARSASRASR